MPRLIEPIKGFELEYDRVLDYTAMYDKREDVRPYDLFDRSERKDVFFGD